MQQNIYHQLEDCQTRIYNALQFGNRKDKEEAFGYAWLHIPDLKEELGLSDSNLQCASQEYANR